MLKDLVKVANRLDSLGLSKEADFIDSLIEKMASDIRDLPEDMHQWTLEDWNEYDQSFIDRGEVFRPPSHDQDPPSFSHKLDFKWLSPEQKLVLLNKAKEFLQKMTPEKLAEIYMEHPAAMENLFGKGTLHEISLPEIK